jgi:tRNA(fMet)-specific endonuclease VapC
MQSSSFASRPPEPIGANDLWIACHVLDADATLVTHNMREFERVTGLAVTGWVES